jgi:transcriptional regulator with PAS, ATPase and Fis domain
VLADSYEEDDARRVLGRGAQDYLAPERRQILNAYEALGGNNTRVAEALGISLATLKRELKSYGVTRSRTQ